MSLYSEINSGKDKKKCKGKGKKKKKKCEEEEEVSVSISGKEEKSCRKDEDNLVKCIADGSYILELEEYTFRDQLIEELQESKLYKGMVKDAVDERKDTIISDFLGSSEFESHVQGVIVEFNQTAEAEKLIEESVNVVVANETSHQESRFNDEVAQVKQSEFEVLELLEQLISNLREISIKDGSIYRNEKVMEVLTAKYLKSITSQSPSDPTLTYWTSSGEPPPPPETAIPLPNWAPYPAHWGPPTRGWLLREEDNAMIMEAERTNEPTEGYNGRYTGFIMNNFIMDDSGWIPWISDDDNGPRDPWEDTEEDGFQYDNHDHEVEPTGGKSAHSLTFGDPDYDTHLGDTQPIDNGDPLREGENDHNQQLGDNPYGGEYMNPYLTVRMADAPVYGAHHNLHNGLDRFEDFNFELDPADPEIPDRESEPDRRRKNNSNLSG